MAGLAPWWVLLETTGNRTGLARRTPLAAGPVTAGAMLLIAVHAGRAGGQASVEALDPAGLRRFNACARCGPALAGRDPLFVRVETS